MNENGNYLQFPLCGLACSDDEWKRLDQIISFGFVEAGCVMFNKFTPELRKGKIEGIKRCSGLPPDYSAADSYHVAALIGAEAIGITIGGSIKASLCRWRELSDFRNQFQARHGRDVEVRIRKDLVFEARDKKGISYRELVVFCAILSCIGAKKYPVRITRQTIQCRMLGYKSPSVMKAETANRADGAKPLSFRQINYTLDKLHERQFFARARANERQTFYSVRLQQDQLENRLLEGKSYSDGFRQRRLERTAILMEKIKQQRAAAIKANTPIKVDNGKDGRSNDGHSASTRPSAEVSA